MFASCSTESSKSYLAQLLIACCPTDQDRENTENALEASKSGPTYT